MGDVPPLSNVRPATATPGTRPLRLFVVTNPSSEDLRNLPERERRPPNRRTDPRLEQSGRWTAYPRESGGPRVSSPFPVARRPLIAVLADF